MRIIQLLPTLSFGDAVSNDARAIGRIIAGMGHETAIYAENVDPRLPKGIALPLEEMPALDAEDVLLYHASTGSLLSFNLPKYGGRKVMVYHNVTPAGFFKDYSAGAERLSRFGREGVRYLAGRVERCIADSAYNREELLRMGYACPVDVCPIIIPFGDYDRPADETVLERYAGDGWTNLLFVGRVAPNKRQEDVIRAFYCYQRRCNPKSRLFLVGSSGGMERYESRLRDYAALLGLKDKVIFPGHIRFNEVLAYYRLADVFVCMSEHEGFCVPLLEAMHFGLPIVAYAATAVPETLGEGGLLLDDKDPELAAAAIDRCLSDDALRRYIAARQAERLAFYGEEASGARMEAILHGLAARP